jgi:hypothetical protein
MRGERAAYDACLEKIAELQGGSVGEEEKEKEVLSPEGGEQGGGAAACDPQQPDAARPAKRRHVPGWFNSWFKA